MCVCVCVCVCQPLSVSLLVICMYLSTKMTATTTTQASSSTANTAPYKRKTSSFRLGLVHRGGGRGLNGSVCGCGLSGGGWFHSSDGNGENTAPVVQRKLREEGMSQVTSHPHPHTHTHTNTSHPHTSHPHTPSHTHTLTLRCRV